MVNERIHIICGNCGSDGPFHWDSEKSTEDEPFRFILICKNCTTHHDITEKIAPMWENKNGN